MNAVGVASVQQVRGVGPLEPDSWMWTYWLTSRFQNVAACCAMAFRTDGEKRKQAVIAATAITEFNAMRFFIANPHARPRQPSRGIVPRS